MGNWTLHIEGIGGHHNGIPSDADALAKEAVKLLTDGGQTVTTASMTYGGSEDLLTGETDGEADHAADYD